MQREDIAARLTGQHQTAIREAGHGAAPVNIALCKYWGKRDDELNLPLTSSLSIALPGLGAETTVRPAAHNRLLLNGQPVADSAPAAARVFEFTSLFTRQPLEVTTLSSVPLAAGLASSASGFAALTRALAELLGWQLEPRDLSILARLGSGSACRSLFTGFVRWNAGTRNDGMDSYAEPLDAQWPALRLGLLCLSDAPKPVSSRAAMRRTRETSMLYRQWPGKIDADMASIESAIRARDFEALGTTTESNALAMHATMIDSWPPVIYWLPGSLAAIHRIHDLRAQGHALFFTMDAGPNVKLLFLENTEPLIRQTFPDCRIIKPFP